MYSKFSTFVQKSSYILYILAVILIAMLIRKLCKSVVLVGIVLSAAWILYLHKYHYAHVYFSARAGSANVETISLSHVTTEVSNVFFKLRFRGARPITWHCIIL